MIGRGMMGRVFTLTAVLAGVVVLAVSAMARSPDSASDWNAPAINWRDIGSGIREATTTQKPVIMVFHAPWCTSCARYRKVFKDPEIIEAAKSFVMILINADKDKVANGAFAPDGTYVPRTIFLDWEGNIRSEIRGASDPKYPHTIDIEGPGELLSLMKKAAPPTGQDAPQAAQQ